MKKAIFSVPGMTCSMCVMHLEGLEDQLAGVERVQAEYVKQRMEVTYDEKQLTLQQVITAAAEQGYQAVLVSEVVL
jgi:P-type Cu+ transporter